MPPKSPTSPHSGAQTRFPISQHNVKSVHRRQIFGIAGVYRPQLNMLPNLIGMLQRFWLWPLLVSAWLSACTYFDEKNTLDRTGHTPVNSTQTARSPVMDFIANASPGERMEFHLPALGGRAIVEVGSPYDSAARLVCKRVNISPIDRSLPVKTMVACHEGGRWTVSGQHSTLLHQ
jgi:hypothetical protein